MKKLLFTAVLLAMIIALTSCSGDNKQPNLTAKPSAQLSEQSEGDKEPDLTEKAGIGPYKLSESDVELLQAFGIQSGRSQILSFKAPEETRSVELKVYTLGQDGSWESLAAVGLSSGGIVSPGEHKGTFAMRLIDNRAVEYYLSYRGGTSFKTEEIEVDKDIGLASSHGFLTKFMEIEIDKEIPVAVMVYDFFESGTMMRSHEPEHYFTPSVFAGMDLVQAVTLTFSTLDAPVPES